jgi:hypothetical protein
MPPGNYILTSCGVLYKPLAEMYGQFTQEQQNAILEDQIKRQNINYTTKYRILY